MFSIFYLKIVKIVPIDKARVQESTRNSALKKPTPANHIVSCGFLIEDRLKSG